MPINPECYPSAIFGCRYPNAINYNPSATVDDGSCVFLTKEFNIQIRASHYQLCIDRNTPTLQQVGFILHIDSITPNYAVTSLQTFIELFAYTDRRLEFVRQGCSNLNPVYIQNPLFGVGVRFRRDNDKGTVIDLQGESPKYSQVFAARIDSIGISTDQDSDIVDGLVGNIENPLNLKIKIIADGQVFTKNETIGIISYNTSVPTPYETIVVN